LILGSVIFIGGFYIYDLQQQNKKKTSILDSLSSSAFMDDPHKDNEDILFDLFSDFDDMQREMDQFSTRFSLNLGKSPLFDSMFKDHNSSLGLDFKEAEGKYIVEVELPGVENSSIDVSVENGMLNIQAETVQQKEQDNAYYTGKLQRSLSLPADADPANMNTKLENGVLVIIIPKYL
jgi:HSP20 family protein